MAADHEELKKRNFDEMVSLFNQKVADMNIARKYKMELLGMITAIEMEHDAKVSKRTAKVEKMHRVSSVIRTGLCGSCGYDVIDSYKHCPGCGARLEWE